MLAKQKKFRSSTSQGLTSIADYMIVASGTSSRQVAGFVDKIDEKLKGTKFEVIRTEGLPTADWVVVDCGDVIVHLSALKSESSILLKRCGKLMLH